MKIRCNTYIGYVTVVQNIPRRKVVILVLVRPAAVLALPTSSQKLVPYDPPTCRLLSNTCLATLILHIFILAPFEGEVEWPGARPSSKFCLARHASALCRTLVLLLFSVARGYAPIC